MQLWQYDILTQASSHSRMDLAKMLDAAGADGWEVVAVRTFSDGRYDGLAEYTLKRPIKPSK